MNEEGKKDITATAVGAVGGAVILPHVIIVGTVLGVVGAIPLIGGIAALGLAAGAGGYVGFKARRFFKR